MNLKMLEPFLIGVLIITLSLFCLPSSLEAKNDPAFEWHLLYIKIRDQLITRQEALVKLTELEMLLKDIYLKSGRGKSDGTLAFPLKGYGPRAIGGKEGSGYQILGYDFFDGSQHKGHPGLDIFIRDKNQNGLDDVTGRPVDVISVSSGMVVSVNFNWSLRVLSGVEIISGSLSR
jgi:hypothetical protein